MKLNVPQPRQRRRREVGGDVDLRDPSDSFLDSSSDDPGVYDTAEHDVYVPRGPDSNADSDEDIEAAEAAERNGFGGAQPSGGAGQSGRSRVGSGRPRFDIRNTWQVLAGSILIPVGVASIILAWYGAAHARVDQQQIPYMVSGGFLGLGAIIAGALFYWAHWLYRIYDQADLHHHELMRSQAELRDALLGAVTGGDHNLNGSSSSAGAGSRSAGSAGPAGGGRFVATSSGTNFHRPDCPIVARRPNGLREVSDRDADELQPCRICDPLAGGA